MIGKIFSFYYNDAFRVNDACLSIREITLLGNIRRQTMVMNTGILYPAKSMIYWWDSNHIKNELDLYQFPKRTNRFNKGVNIWK